MAKMVSGIDVLVLRPGRRAQAARAARARARSRRRPSRRRPARTSSAPASRRARRERAGWPTSRRRRTPGSTSPTGTAFYHHHRSWIDDTTLPIATIGSYIERLEAGEDISRPSRPCSPSATASPSSTARSSPTRSLQAFDEQSRARAHGLPLRREPQLLHRPPVPHDLLEQGARVRSPARRARLPGRPGGRLLPAPRRGACGARGAPALLELRRAGARSGPAYWPPIVERRKAIYEAMRRWVPPPASASARRDHRADHGHALGHHRRAHPGLARILRRRRRGHADRVRGLAGRGRGPSARDPAPRPARRARGGRDPRRAFHVDELDARVRQDRGGSTRHGGIMCHAAIVAREYGLPAVVGTGTATKRIKTGDRLHVDANTGVVTILG